jgi:hypothetical protein
VAVADISSCWCLCVGDSGVGVAAVSFSIAVDELASAHDWSYRAMSTLTCNREAWCGLNVLDTFGRRRGGRRRCFSFNGRGLNLLHGAVELMIVRDAIRNAFRQSGFGVMLHNSCIRLHVSLYNSHTAISTNLLKPIDALTSSVSVQSSRNMSSRDSPLDHLQTEQTATQTLLNRATGPFSCTLALEVYA